MDEDNTSSSAKKTTNGNKSYEPFYQLVREKSRNNPRIAILSHPSPDPDAIGSQMGLAWGLERTFGVDVDTFIAGEISHPQNLTMEKLLSPKLIPLNQYNKDNYGLTVLVDTIPSNAGRGDLVFDAVIDHHVEVPVVNNEGYYFLNLHTGSCCGTIYSMLRDMGLEFEEDTDYDQRVATAMLVGIYTDTCGLLGDRCMNLDREAYNGLFDFRNPEALKEIAKFKRPRHWVDMKSAAVSRAVTQDGVAVVGIGMVSLKHRDIIADQADDMLQWEGVNLSISFALVDGETLQGSVRSMCASVSAAKLCRMLGEERGGSGWGHAAAGGYRYPLAGFSLGLDEDETTKAEAWSLLQKREISRIGKLMKK